MLFTEDGKWKPSKMNKTCFDSLCKIEAFSSLSEMSDGTIENHRQLHEIIVGNYDKLKKGRHGITKTAAKKLMKEAGSVPDFIPEKIRENIDLVDWTRELKIGFNVDLMSGVDEALVFPAKIMAKIDNAELKPITSMEGNEKGIVWFCIQEMHEKLTKNGKKYYRMRVMDNNSESCWLRVWGGFNNKPELYTMWLAEVASTESWGCSTSSYKMKKIDV
jgi:DNA polymerase III alpha subunit